MSFEILFLIFPIISAIIMVRWLNEKQNREACLHD